MLGLGAIASLALMLYAGRNSPRILTGVFIIWVGSPFLALAWLDRRADTWRDPVRTCLNALMVGAAVITTVLFAVRVIWPPQAQAAFVFVIVPPLTWLIGTLALGVAGLASRK